jgi:hypothetical protein
MFLISHASLPNDAIISPLEFGGRRAAIFYFAAASSVCFAAAGKTLGKRFAAVHQSSTT